MTSVAHAVFGASTYAESEGTYTNFQGRVQHFTPAVVTAENMRRMGMKMSRLDRFGAPNDRWTQGDKRDCRQAWQIIQGIAVAAGASWTYGSSASVFADIVATVSGFEGMSYEILDHRHGVVLHKINEPEPVEVVYESHYMKP
ncbi:MAG: hypothetical protein ACKOAG_00995, partial [Candidatus Kapaibacterium sp.]